MNEFRDFLSFRISQFRSLLETMQERRRSLTKGNAYLIIEERKDDPVGESAALQAAAKMAIPTAATVGEEVFGAALGEEVSIDLPEEGWRGDPASRRFIQFGFCAKYFEIDIPNTTLYRAEAQEILRYRSGFFYVVDRPQFEHPAERARDFNPLRKAYVYGDEQVAAEDGAFVFFRVWKFPVDWRFFVSASSFHDGIHWERGLPLEANSE